MKYEHLKPTSAINHDERRAALPTSELQGEEAAVVGNAPQQSAYDTFRHAFTRGCDPELYWLDKYKNDDEATQDLRLHTDIRSLYVHEDISPESLIDQLYEQNLQKAKGEEAQMDFFGDNTEDDELERVAGYYQHTDNWKNRLIQGDSLLVMNSLLNREGMAGQVQCIYIDPPYGIKYGGNWQMHLNSTNVKDNDSGLSSEPEMIKAYRDTWELGIHSYLSYLRDRLVMARELLTESGSCFVQISDENVHLVRTIMDDVFGSENFVSQIIFTKTTGFTANTIGNVCDFILWYANDISMIKVRKIFEDKDALSDPHYNNLEMLDGRRMTILQWEKENKQEFVYSNKPEGCRVFTFGDTCSQGEASATQPYEFNGKTYYPSSGRHWTANYPKGMDRLKDLGRLYATENKLRYIRYFDDFPKMEITNLWTDILGVQSRKDPKVYVVQTATKAIQRCILMTTDPGDLVLDPTCGSGTTAYVAEQWGRRWITMDTSRIALNIAKRRLTTALFSYYKPYDQSPKPNIRQGFIYKRVPHITLKSLANNMPPEEETLYDQPEEDKTKLRVSGPFTVETLQNFNIAAPESLQQQDGREEEAQAFMDRIFSHLQSSGIRNGAKEQQTLMRRMEAVANPYLNARGWYEDEQGRERVAYFLIGSKYGTVSRTAVNQAVKEIRALNNSGVDAPWLVVLGFSFEDNINDRDYNFGAFRVSKVRMSDDLLQEGLLKTDKGAGSFIIIGEPDIRLVRDDDSHAHVEILGMDIYNPLRDTVEPRNVEDIAYWEMDTNYNGTHFHVRSIHFCGGGGKEFDKWRKALEARSKGAKVSRSQVTKNRTEHTLRVELRDEMWDSLYGTASAPFPCSPGQKVAVRVVSQFGEECTKVVEIK